MATPFKTFVLTLVSLIGSRSVNGVEENELMKSATGRSINRFTIGHRENIRCWDKHVDGIFSVIDAHNHFRPFGGPAVPFDEYLGWMKDHGIVFSTMFGIGQRIRKHNSNDPECCYYLHCPTPNYTVVPDPKNDIENAKDFTEYANRDDQPIHLTLSASFPNFQRPGQNVRILKYVTKRFPNTFSWVGETNIYKHALAGNGFFTQPNITENQVNLGAFDDFFKILETQRWPVTLHCDIGCDNYDHIPFRRFNVTPVGCGVPDLELKLAQREHTWWRNILGIHYEGFFHMKSGIPKWNFRKIQHLKLWDTIIGRYYSVNIVWAHIGLSKELRDLHPTVHVHIVKELLTRHRNLYVDISWDVLAKMVHMDYKGEPISELDHLSHEDLTETASDQTFDAWKIEVQRKNLHGIFEQKKHLLHDAGSINEITGPTHALAIYLELIHEFSDRFVTGTDFVASSGGAEEYPGLRRPGKGCKKERADHARQLSDTSAINMFLDDTAFKRIVLGGNYFRLTGTSGTYRPPEICSSKASGVSHRSGRQSKHIWQLVSLLLCVSAFISKN